MGIRHKLPLTRWLIVLSLPLLVPATVVIIDGEVTTVRPLIACFSAAALSVGLYDVWSLEPINIIPTDDVMDVTGDQPMSVSEIAEELPYSEQIVRKRMKSLVEEGTYEPRVVAESYSYQRIPLEESGLGPDPVGINTDAPMDRGNSEADEQLASGSARSKHSQFNREEADKNDLEPKKVSLELEDGGNVIQQSEKVYVGNEGDYQVRADGEPIDPATDIVNHSHTGDLSWGYSGSGPAQLAAALIADAVGPEAARKHYYDFYADVTSNLPNSFKLPAEEIRAYVKKAEKRETSSA